MPEPSNFESDCAAAVEVHLAIDCQLCNCEKNKASCTLCNYLAFQPMVIAIRPEAVRACRQRRASMASDKSKRAPICGFTP
jgi:hypothetical protein